MLPPATGRVRSALRWPLVLVAVSCLTMSAATSAKADVTALTGRATAGVSFFAGGPTVTMNPFPPEVTLSAPPGGLGPFDASGPIGSIASGNVAVSTHGDNLGSHAGFVTSTATMTGVSVPGHSLAGVPDFTAEAVSGSCTATAEGSVSTVTLTGAKIFGQPVPDGPVPPGTQFFNVVQLQLGGFELATIFLNERTLTNAAGATSVTMNAFRIHLEQNIGPRTGLALGQLQCAAAGPDVNSTSSSSSSSSTSSTTTSTTVVTSPTPSACERIEAARELANNRLDQAEQQLMRFMGGPGLAAAIAQLERARAQTNAQIAAAHAAAVCAVIRTAGVPSANPLPTGLSRTAR